jgi:hypothetical protein
MGSAGVIYALSQYAQLLKSEKPYEAQILFERLEKAIAKNLEAVSAQELKF